MRDLAALPKAHLHLHLEAGMSPELLAELSAKYDREVPVIRGFGSFAAFSETYVAATDVLREREDWERLADELCATHVAQGAVYLEPAFWAGNYRHRFASDQACWELVWDVFDAAADRHGIEIGWMVPVDRVRDSPSDGDRARPVRGGQPRARRQLRAPQRRGRPPAAGRRGALPDRPGGGLLITPHAGELESGQFVLDSIDLLGAGAHRPRGAQPRGARPGGAPGAERICLDVCPTSNIMLSVFPSYAEHSLPALLDAGVPLLAER